MHDSKFFTLFVLLSVSIFNYINRALLSPNYNIIMAEFQVSQGQIGLVSTMFSVTVAAFTVILGYLNDKWNRKKMLFCGGLWYGGFSLLVSISTNYGSLLAFNIGMGMGIGVVLPVAYSIVSDLFHSSTRSKVFSIFGIATTLGDVIGSLLAGIYGDSGDWRTPFFIVGIINLCSSGLVAFIKNPQRAAKEELLEDVLAQTGATYDYHIHRADLKYIYLRKTNFYLIINFVDNVPGGILRAWVITWLVTDHGMPKSVATEIFLLAAAFSLVGSIVGGYLGDKWFKQDKRIRVKIAMMAMILEVPFLILSVAFNFEFTPLTTLGDVFGNATFMFCLLMFCIFFFIDSWTGPNWYSTIMDVNLPEHRGTILSVGNLVDAIGAGIGPVLGGLLFEWVGSYQLVFWVASIINIFGFLFWIPMYTHVRKDIADVETVLKQRREEILARANREKQD